MKKCEICLREFIALFGSIFMKTGEKFIGIPNGISIFVCKECYLCYLMQYMKTTNQELNHLLNFFER